ncbi:unnamed protein product [Anisakis simplex]|uniref:COGC-1 (inferred by orthology to a C. elegans protein) n=1 Tax=Anisakis simplex TaxID=6269 RepID=A0A0M3JB67_ANISI|nr:unnamed protein product [Anisakis simplex]
MDPLTDAYVLIIVGNMHRSLSVETKTNELRHFGGFVRSMSKRLIAAKLKLEKELMSELSKIDHPDQVTNQLTAIAILTKCSIEQLLDIFLRQKMTVKRDLSVGSQSLIDIVWRIRHTFECVQRLFVNGQLTNTLRIFRNRNWIPKMLMDYLNNEALSFSKCLLPEIESANEQCASLQVETVDSQVLLTKCNSFLERLLNIFRLIHVNCLCCLLHSIFI